MQQLQSYLSGRWQAGEGEGNTLHNPTNGEAVARTSTFGLDLGGALSYAREVGGPALRALTFAERGQLLAAMSKAIHAKRESLIEIGRLNAGNTRSDAKFDIDGATGTLMYYAGLAKTLGDRKTLLDEELLTLGRPGTRLQGQHVLLPRSGVAIHINAFNFPCWGLAEKAACAILAGMPVVGKPATATAWMTEAMVRAITDAEILPAGVLSVLCGSVGDLLEHVKWGDVIAFTGSANTGLRIRSQASVLSANVMVNVEADSLNATVLAPDPDDATYDAFIRHMGTEITQKAGQKCTATRRIFVPIDALDEVIEDLSERLDQITVGDPALDDVRMGPLASAAQLLSVKEGIAALSAEAKVVYGDPEGGVRKGIDPGQGYFQNPLLLRINDAHAGSAVHSIEVFGPISTVMGYDGSAADAVDLVQKGQGCLVTSIYGDDRKYLREAILGIAPNSGRVVVTDAKVANAALSPGVVMPHLMHGGPGRAGGGVELGGLRGMVLYQQRTAIQGNGPLLAKLLDD